ncbi:DUF2829 domain-containing protein [Hymenobacter terricola]|uniref:DUF2829 domain-containing protein n=1 Tax=Hymenobacter terricola TaxID=2819236 RepID=UPI001B310EB8|nr:DUF2829 domain-containing protein [Hymenobacter terricola]
MNIAKKNIDFGCAVCAAKRGQRIARAGWNGKGMFVFIRPADQLDVHTIVERVKSLPQSVKDFFKEKYPLTHPIADVTQLPVVHFGEYFCMYAADGSIVNGWLASQTDMLATDWCILD